MTGNNLSNLSSSLKKELTSIIETKIKSQIIPGKDYIPVSGKLIDPNDILFGVDATLDAWLTTGRYAKQFDPVQYISTKFFHSFIYYQFILHVSIG